MKKNQNKVKFLVKSAIIAALYVVLTFVARVFGLDSGAIQVRISESLVALLFFTPAAIPGLTIGCLLSNILVGCVFWDVVFGTLATLIGAVAGYALRKYKYAVLIPNILSNAIIVPFVLKYVYAFDGALYYFIITVGIGEIISCGILGMVLMMALMPIRNVLFKSN